jgi:putative tryptophan/tyrosine transport system substrate-binding protein
MRRRDESSSSPARTGGKKLGLHRRTFMSLLGGALAMWPFAARAQQGQMPVIGFLDPGSPGPMEKFAGAFRKGLSEAGFSEGRNVVLEYRWGDGHYDTLPSLAADLVNRRVQVIVANGPAVLPAKAATTTLPIVFTTGADPVASGLVASLNRPGGNITGITSLGIELDVKRLELLRSVVSSNPLFAVLLNPHNVNAPEVRLPALRATAATLGLQLEVLYASTKDELEAAFAKLAAMRPGGLVIGGDLLFNTYAEDLAALCERYSIPAIFQYRSFAAAGGLMSYGGDRMESGRLSGVYAGRILKGEKPSELPVQESTKVELFINLKSAKALGIDVPLALLGRADEVIE